MLVLSIVVVIAMLFGGCAANDAAYDKEMMPEEEYFDNTTGSEDWYDDDYGYTEESKEESAEDWAEPEAPESGVASDGMVGETHTERKIIMRAEYNIETKEYENSYAKLLEMTEQMGGYVSQSDYSGTSLNGYGRDSRYCTVTIRIPAEKYTQYTNALSDVGNISYSYESRSDVTTQYYDLKARIESLEVQEDRLLDLLGKAETIDEILQIENQLSDVRYRIESYMTNFKVLSDQVSYSTVTVRMEEVVEYSPEPIKKLPFGEKLFRSLTNGWENFVEFWEYMLLDFVVALPFLVLIAIIITVIVLLCRRAAKKRKQKKQAAIDALKSTPPAEKK